MTPAPPEVPGQHQLSPVLSHRLNDAEGRTRDRVPCRPVQFSKRSGPVHRVVTVRPSRGIHRALVTTHIQRRRLIHARNRAPRCTVPRVDAAQRAGPEFVAHLADPLRVSGRGVSVWNSLPRSISPDANAVPSAPTEVSLHQHVQLPMEHAHGENLARSSTAHRAPPILGGPGREIRRRRPSDGGIGTTDHQSPLELQRAPAFNGVSTAHAPNLTPAKLGQDVDVSGRGRECSLERAGASRCTPRKGRQPPPTLAVPRHG